jgi:hypothetical protein
MNVNEELGTVCKEVVTANFLKFCPNICFKRQQGSVKAGIYPFEAKAHLNST